MALMTALLIVSTYIKIPLPFSSASITAQTFNGKPDRTSAFPLTDTGGYGNLDPVKCCWYWWFFRKLLGPAGGYRYGNLVAAVMISMFCCKV